MKQKIIEQIKKVKFFHKIKKFIYQTSDKKYEKNILISSDTNNFISNLLISTNPCMITRYGSIELKIIETYLKNKKYTKKMKYTIKNNAGFFESTDKNLDLFAESYIKDSKNIDLLGISNLPFEDYMANKIIDDCELTKLRNLEPYFFDNPWSYHLKDKKVLVIHPFNQSIEKQYKKRELLFKNQNILPEFTLVTYPAIQSLGGNDEYESWFQALAKMKNDISKIDFDVAIIGAGAYGLPLASYIKDLGKKAIHLGGATQMLFGVYGQRWAIHPDFQDIINEHWAKPTPNEKPNNASKVENACYW
jgi:hypothetical protein